MDLFLDSRISDFKKNYLSSLRTHREKMYKFLIYFQVYKEKSTCFKINKF